MSVGDKHSEMVQQLKSADYEKIAERLSDPKMIDITHAILGIGTEGVGEIADAFKRHIFYGTELDTVNLKEELGDCMWYIQLLAVAIGCDLDEIMQTNIDKLRKRYGDKFTEEAAVDRDLGAEREILERSEWVFHTNETTAPLDYSRKVEAIWTNERDELEISVSYPEAFGWGHGSPHDVIKWRYGD